VARGHERSVNGAHEGIDTSIAYFKVFIERAQRLVKRGRIEFAAIFALESDGEAEKWRVQESGDALRTMIGEGVQTDLSPGFSVERRDIIQRKRITLRLFTAIHVEQQNRPAVAPGGVMLLG